MISRALVMLASAVLLTAAADNGDERFRLDGGAIHSVAGNGRDRILLPQSAVANARVSGDGASVAWLARSNGAQTANKLKLRSHGHTRTISCEPIIRDFWFVEGARRIAIDCGGEHFAGREILYDAETLKELESFDQATLPESARPAWAR